MKYSLLLLFAVLHLLSCSSPQQENTENMTASEAESAREDHWRALFNGKDMSGWIPKIRGYEPGENYGNTFRVEDGLLKVRYDQYDDFAQQYGHIFYE